MSFNTIVSNAGRLEILTALAVEEIQDFVTLRKRTQLTDGNLASHAKRLHAAGLVGVQKSFREGKPVTSFHLTTDGRKALEQHVRRLMSALSQRRVSTEPEMRTPVMAEVVAPRLRSDDEWVD
ncbi:MAG TPA: transcriptional regulator [Tepidisphaeraceae bacterium]|jgi:DNA-binding MarR family transcriptional regulator|nr:transcriptional regulator [Tepidisphaeraceae bacterium]